MAPRFSIWMVLAGVMVGVMAGYLVGSGILSNGKEPGLLEVREQLSKGVDAERRGEMLRGFDEAVRRAKER